MTSLPSSGAKPRVMRSAHASAKEAAASSGLEMHPAPYGQEQGSRVAGQLARSFRMDAETAIARLEEAGQTLLSLPRTGPTTALRQARYQYVSEALDTYTSANSSRPRPPVPAATNITRMDQALAWITLIPRDNLVLRRIVGCRCLVSPLTGRHLFGWRQLARTLSADHKAVQRWHATGIDLIVAALNCDAAVATSRDTLA